MVSTPFHYLMASQGCVVYGDLHGRGEGRIAPPPDSLAMPAQAILLGLLLPGYSFLSDHAGEV